MKFLILSVLVSTIGLSASAGSFDFTNDHSGSREQAEAVMEAAELEESIPWEVRHRRNEAILRLEREDKALADIQEYKKSVDNLKAQADFNLNKTRREFNERGENSNLSCNAIGNLAGRNMLNTVLGIMTYTADRFLSPKQLFNCSNQSSEEKIKTLELAILDVELKNSYYFKDDARRFENVRRQLNRDLQGKVYLNVFKPQIKECGNQITARVREALAKSCFSVLVDKEVSVADFENKSVFLYNHNDAKQIKESVERLQDIISAQKSYYQHSRSSSEK